MSYEVVRIVRGPSCYIYRTSVATRPFSIHRCLCTPDNLTTDQTINGSFKSFVNFIQIKKSLYFDCFLITVWTIVIYIIHMGLVLYEKKKNLIARLSSNPSSTQILTNQIAWNCTFEENSRMWGKSQFEIKKKLDPGHITTIFDSLYDRKQIYLDFNKTNKAMCDIL